MMQAIAISQLGADVDMNNGQLLEMAVEKSAHEQLHFLHMARANFAINNGRAHRRAIAIGDEEVVGIFTLYYKELKEANANLRDAVIARKLSKVNEAIKAGARAHLADGTIMQQAISKGSAQIVAALISFGTPVVGKGYEFVALAITCLQNLTRASLDARAPFTDTDQAAKQARRLNAYLEIIHELVKRGAPMQDSEATTLTEVAQKVRTAIGIPQTGSQSSLESGWILSLRIDMAEMPHLKPAGMLSSAGSLAREPASSMDSSSHTQDAAALGNTLGSLLSSLFGRPSKPSTGGEELGRDLTYKFGRLTVNVGKVTVSNVGATEAPQRLFEENPEHNAEPLKGETTEKAQEPTDEKGLVVSQQDDATLDHGGQNSATPSGETCSLPPCRAPKVSGDEEAGGPTSTDSIVIDEEDRFEPSCDALDEMPLTSMASADVPLDGASKAKALIPRGDAGTTVTGRGDGDIAAHLTNAISAYDQEDAGLASKTTFSCQQDAAVDDIKVVLISNDRSQLDHQDTPKVPRAPPAKASELGKELPSKGPESEEAAGGRESTLLPSKRDSPRSSLGKKRGGNPSVPFRSPRASGKGTQFTKPDAAMVYASGVELSTASQLKGPGNALNQRDRGKFKEGTCISPSTPPQGGPPSADGKEVQHCIKDGLQHSNTPLHRSANRADNRKAPNRQSNGAFERFTNRRKSHMLPRDDKRTTGSKGSGAPKNPRDEEFSRGPPPLTVVSYPPNVQAGGQRSYYNEPSLPHEDAGAYTALDPQQAAVAVRVMEEQRQNALINACLSNDWPRVRLCLSWGIPVAGPDHVAMRVASANFHFGIIQDLLAAGADLGANGRPLLNEAIRKGNMDAVQMLLHYGAFKEPKANLLPLLTAVEHGMIQIAALLLHHGADANARGGQPLMLALEVSSFDLVDLLLKSGADASPISGRPLIKALSQGHYELITRLIRSGANLNIFNGLPLRMAVHMDRIDIFLLLLSAGADPERGSERVLAAATEQSYQQMANQLAHARSVKQAANGDFAAICAMGDLKAAQMMLFSRRVDINHGRGEALIRAAGNGHLEMAKWLVQNGADPLARQKSALALAITSGHGEVAAFLEAAAGEAAEAAACLKAAYREGNLEAVLALQGAHASIVGRHEGLLMDAVASGSVDLVRLLLAHGAHPDVPHFMPLHMAVEAGNEPIVIALLTAGACAVRANARVVSLAEAYPQREIATALMAAATTPHAMIPC